jgi:hypothetical protein
VFIIAGSEDVRTACPIFRAGRPSDAPFRCSCSHCSLPASGSLARGFRLLLLLAPIVYAADDLLHARGARCSMTMQPFVFAFVAVQSCGDRRADAGEDPVQSVIASGSDDRGGRKCAVECRSPDTRAAGGPRWPPDAWQMIASDTALRRIKKTLWNSAT